MTKSNISNKQIYKISTHTLTWSVTILLVFCYSHMEISTHTLTWSVTSFYNDDYSLIPNFNSHAHVERDRTYICYTIDTVISTHTLTWSVTTCVYMLYYRYSISTHTLTWSVTIQLFIYVILAKISTHTLTWSVTILMPMILLSV